MIWCIQTMSQEFSNRAKSAYPMRCKSRSSNVSERGLELLTFNFPLLEAGHHLRNGVKSCEATPGGVRELHSSTCCIIAFQLNIQSIALFEINDLGLTWPCCAVKSLRSVAN